MCLRDKLAIVFLLYFVKRDFLLSQFLLVLFYDVYYIKKSPFWEEAHVTKFAVIVCVLFTKQWKFHGNVTDFGGDWF